MDPHPQASVIVGGHDRAGVSALPSGSSDRRWLGRLRPTALKPVTYSVMHLIVAITVAYVLTRDWRIALGVGVIEPIVQTIAYMAHEKAWTLGSRTKARADG